MLCPQCSLELIIKSSHTVAEDDKAVTIQDLYCRNPQCSLGRTNTLVKQLKHYHDNEIPEPDDDLITCHGNTLARVGDGEYFIPEYINSFITDTTAHVTCPDCGRSYEFPINVTTDQLL